MRSCYECEYEYDKLCKRYPPKILADYNIGFPSLKEYNEGCGEFKLKRHIELNEFGEMMDRIERGE